MMFWLGVVVGASITLMVTVQVMRQLANTRIRKAVMQAEMGYAHMIERAMVQRMSEPCPPPPVNPQRDINPRFEWHQ